MLIPPEIYNEIQEMVELQDNLYDLCEENYSEFLGYLSNSPFLSDSIYVRKLLLCIYSAFRFNFKNTTLLCRILVEIKDYLKKYLTSDEIVMNLRNNAARVALFECGLINIESIIKDSSFNNFCFRFFYPEIKEHDEKFYNKTISENRFLKQTMGYLAEDVNLHKELRRLGKSEHRITQIIRDDDIDAFQEYVSLKNYALTEQVPYSVYDTNDFANNEDNMPYLIECAAFYGSIKIFKYIYMSLDSLNIDLPTTLPSYAVAGGNYDVIHIVEESFKKIQNEFGNSNIKVSDDVDDDDDDDEMYEEKRINLLQNTIFRNRNGLPDQIKLLMKSFNEKRVKLSTFARSNVIQAAIEFHRDNVLDYIIDGYSPRAQKIWQSSRTFISTIQFLNFRQMLYFLTSDENNENENSSAEDSEVENAEEETKNETEIKNDDENKNENDDDENKNDDDENETKNDENENKNDDDENETKNDENENKNDDDENETKNDDDENETKNDENENKNDDENENKNDEEAKEEENTKWVFDINAAPKQGYPPLIQSVFESRIDVIRFILSAKNLDVNITTYDGCSSLILASMYGYVSIIKLLCEMKHDEIDFNQKSKNGSTAFLMACHYGRYEIVEYLASLTKSHFKSMKSENENKENENKENENKENENKENENKENENKENENKENENKEIENKEIENKENENNENENKENENKENENKENENKENENKETENNETENKENDDNEESSDLIIDVNKTDDRGFCPFYIACMSGNIKIVKFLASFNGIKMIQNYKLPHQIAAYLRHQDVIDFLNNNPIYQEQKRAFEEEKEKNDQKNEPNHRLEIFEDDDLLFI